VRGFTTSLRQSLSSTRPRTLTWEVAIHQAEMFQYNILHVSYGPRRLTYALHSLDKHTNVTEQVRSGQGARYPKAASIDSHRS
jgi:hypothetical protein